jgi:hypothetical protein
MVKLSYPVYLKPADEGGFVATFPQVPKAAKSRHTTVRCIGCSILPTRRAWTKRKRRSPLWGARWE